MKSKIQSIALNVVRTFLFGMLVVAVPTNTSFAAVDDTFKNGSGESFLKGTYVEVGVAANGHFGTTGGVPSGKGLHPKNGSNIGFVADRLENGTWYDGDFFLPGSPYEGWYTDVAGSTGKFDDSNSSGATGSQTMSSIDVSSTTASVVHTTVVNGITIAQTYSVPIGASAAHQLDISVTMTNSSGSSKSGIYYGRSVDPDNLVNQSGSGGSYTTTNKIEAQYGIDGKTYSLVSAKSSDNRQTPAGTSYLGLFSADARSKVARYTSGFGTPSTAASLIGGSMITSATDAGQTADAGIALVMDVGTLANGASTTFTYSYVLSAASAADAIRLASSPPAPNSVGVNGSALVSWGVPTSSETITGYIIRYASGSPTGSTTTIDYSPDTSTSHTVTGLTNGTNYYFAVAAITASGIGLWSETTTAVPIGVPLAFVINSHSETGETSTVNFVEAVSSTPDPVLNYEYSLDGGATWTALSPVDTSTAIEIPGILAGHSYPAKLRALNVNGPSPATSIGTLYGPPVWSDTATADAVAGIAYSNGVAAAEGATYTVSPSDALSSIGLTLNASTGAITGTPTAEGTFNFVITATNPNSSISNSDSITVTVNGSAPTWSGTSLPGMTTGTAANIATLAVGATSYILTGTLPTGLSLNLTTGAITGTPTVAGSYSFTICAKNSYGCRPQLFTGTISSPQTASSFIPPAVVFTTTSLGTLTSKSPFSGAIAAENAIAYDLEGGSLPAGLTLDTWTGKITGTPTVVGPYSFTVRARSMYSVFASRTFSGTVAEVAVVTPAPTSAPDPVVVKPLDPVKPAETTQGPAITPVLVNGAPSGFVIIPNSTQNGLLVNADNWSLKLRALDSNGTQVALAPSEHLVVNQGHSVGVDGTGFKPNSDVKVYVFSDPILLGTVKTDATGSFAATLPIAQDFTIGTHTLQVSGYSPKDDVRTASVGLLVKETAKATAAVEAAAAKRASRVVPFAKAKYKIGTSQAAVIKQLPIQSMSIIVVTGYADATSGQDDIRVSLDRALEVKAAILKRFPKAQVTALGGGTKLNVLCKATKNKCAVVRVIKK